jgi:ankyrin repeat protein
MQGLSLLQDDEPLAVELTELIRSGETDKLKVLLKQNPGLSRVKIVTEHRGRSDIRSLLHIAADWPGFIPNGPEIIKALVQAGADVNAPFEGAHAETPLHFAASNNDVPALDALLEAGAELEAKGSVIDGGTALSDAVAFGQWDTAKRLVQRSSKMLLWHATALGEMDAVMRLVEQEGAASRQELTQALWLACHGGQREAAEYVHRRGAELDWIGYDGLTALEAARRSGADELADWLVSCGAKAAGELK